MTGQPTTGTAGALGQSRLLRPGFAGWLGAATVSATGDGVLYFALGWTASSLGGQVAGVVLTLDLLPSALLVLVGGTLGDRLGLRRTMIICDLALCVALLGYLLAAHSSLPLVYLLAGLAVTTGTITAFQLPADGAFPRLFFDADLLPRAMSLTGSVLQVAQLAGPPLGGLIVAALTMTGAVTVDLASFLVILPALLLIRPPREVPVDRAEGSTVTQIKQVLATARMIPGVLPMLVTIGLVAATLIPVLSLCVPLAAHQRDWSAGATGLVEGCWIAGSLATSLLVAKTGTHPHPIKPMVAGTVTAALGLLALALSPSEVAAMAAAVAMGIGTTAFTSHLFPLFLLQAPDGMLARFQSLLVGAQFAPMLLANNLLGAVAAASAASTAMILAASLTLLAPVTLLSSGTLRQYRSAS